MRCAGHANGRRGWKGRSERRSRNSTPALRLAFFLHQPIAEFRTSLWNGSATRRCGSCSLSALIGIATSAPFLNWRRSSRPKKSSFLSTANTTNSPPKLPSQKKIGRASCREECVSTCRSRRSPNHYKEKQEIYTIHTKNIVTNTKQHR